MNLKHRADEILGIQKKAVQNLQSSDQWLTAIELIYSKAKALGRIVTTGMGKAGIIAKKMSATLSSIGVPSFYVHPAESLHGDLGRITSEDLVVVFSHSGSTEEVQRMITHLKILNNQENTIIIITGSIKPVIPYDHLVSYGKIEESSFVTKVPSTSTTLMLIIADVLAITAAEALGFSDEWFQQRHPGGSIGKSYKKTENH